MTTRPRVLRLFDSFIPSGNAYKVHLSLAQLGLGVDVVELNFMSSPSETRTPEFLAKNPNGKIPFAELEDGSLQAESNAVLLYLTEGSDLMPQGSLERARLLSWLFFEQYSHERSIAVLKFWTY